MEQRSTRGRGREWGGDAQGTGAGSQVAHGGPGSGVGRGATRGSRRGGGRGVTGSTEPGVGRRHKGPGRGAKWRDGFCVLPAWPDRPDAPRIPLVTLARYPTCGRCRTPWCTPAPLGAVGAPRCLGASLEPREGTRRRAGGLRTCWVRAEGPNDRGGGGVQRSR